MTEEINTYGTSVPVCPYCGYRDYSWYDCSALKSDGDEAEIDCARCEHQYWVKISIDISFETGPVLAAHVQLQCTRGHAFSLPRGRLRFPAAPIGHTELGICPVCHREGRRLAGQTLTVIEGVTK